METYERADVINDDEASEVKSFPRIQTTALGLGDSRL